MSGIRKRLSTEELVDAVLEALPVRTYATVEGIRLSVGCSWQTAKTWLELIIYIQGLPKVVSSRRPSGPGEVYRRERQKHHKQEG